MTWFYGLDKCEYRYTDHWVPSSSPGSTLEFFSSGELFHGIDELGLYLPMFHPIMSLEETRALC